MTNSTRSLAIEKIGGAIDIPDSAYEKAEARYKDLAGWFGREDARCYRYDPHIHSQGSFSLGTVVRPVDDDDDYDLDMGCRLRSGVTKATHTQQQLKTMVGADLEDYRVARGIQEPREEKHRCWRLKYADTLRFHLDAVPSIPETTSRRLIIQEAMLRAGTPSDLAVRVADLTGAITDDRTGNYRVVSDEWPVSNSEGFALWFESRMALAKGLMESLSREARAARVDRLPAHRWKSPLQRCVQLLKRHRDIMFADDSDGKPISVILTILAGRAYQGEPGVVEALDRILSTMGSLVNPTIHRVPNPVQPAEDFADRWRDPSARHLNVEAKFWAWLQKAQEDFSTIGDYRKPQMLVEAAREKFGAKLNARDFGGPAGGGLLKAAAAPSGLSFPDKPLVPKKPAGFARGGCQI